VPNEENPEELTYAFAFREAAEPDADSPQLWYLVGQILDCDDAEVTRSELGSVRRTVPP